MNKIPGYVELMNYLIFMDMDEFEKIKKYYADSDMIKQMERSGVKRKRDQAPYIIDAIYMLDRDCYPDKEIERLRKIIRDGVAAAWKAKGYSPFREEDDYEWTKEY